MGLVAKGAVFNLWSTSQPFFCGGNQLQWLHRNCAGRSVSSVARCQAVVIQFSPFDSPRVVSRWVKSKRALGRLMQLETTLTLCRSPLARTVCIKV